MDDIKKQGEIKTPEKNISAGEQAIGFKQESEPIKETKEVSSYEKIAEQELRKEIELMQINPDLEKAAKEKSNKISFLADEDKLKNLLQIAKDKGIVFAVKVAKSMNDPFLLDRFHDLLAKEGYYKNFIKE